jgi:hypothetical protein
MGMHSFVAIILAVGTPLSASAAQFEVPMQQGSARTFTEKSLISSSRVLEAKEADGSDFKIECGLPFLLNEVNVSILGKVIVFQMERSACDYAIELAAARINYGVRQPVLVFAATPKQPIHSIDIVEKCSLCGL